MLKRALAKNDKLKVWVDAVGDLNKKVGTGPWTALSGADFDRDVSFAVAGQKLKVGAHAGAGLNVHSRALQIENLWSAGSRTTAPSGKSFVELHLALGAGVVVDGRLPTRSVAVSYRLDSRAEALYRHLMPASSGETRRAALTRTIQRASLRPEKIRFKTLPKSGAFHVYEAWLNVDLGLSARYRQGVNFNRVVELFDDLDDQPIKAHFELTLQAGMGWSHYRRTEIVVGAAEQNPKWCRVRFEKTRKSRLSVSAGVEFNALYDLAKPLETIFDYALDLDGTRDVFDALERVATYRTEGAWDQIKNKLPAWIDEELAELFEDSNWRSAPILRSITEFSQEFNASVAELDADVAARVHSLWADVLDFSQLRPSKPLGRTLKKIAAIDPELFELQSLLGEEQRSILEFVEQLTGQTLEQLLLSDSRIEALSQAQQAAAKILEFAERAPADVIGKFRKLKKKSGIDRVVAFLDRNASSKEKLEGAIENQVRPRIKRLSERLAGKVWEELGPDDVARLQSWAQKVQDFLEDKEEWEASMRATLSRLRGEFGFSLALELERVSEKSALIDLEFNPSHSATRHAVKRGLKDGDVVALLDALPDPQTDAEDSDAAETHWSIREGLLTSRRLRSGALSFLSTVTQRTRRAASRAEHARVEISDEGRNAEVGANFTRSYEQKGGRATEASVTWFVEGQSASVKPSQAYDADLQEQLQLSFSLADRRTQLDEVLALDNLLREIGFVSQPTLVPILQSESGDSVEGSPVIIKDLDTQFSIDLVLPPDAVEDLFDVSDRAWWDHEYLNAAHRWFTEGLIVADRQSDGVARNAAAHAAVVRDETFRTHWMKGIPTLRSRLRERYPDGRLTARLGGQSFSFGLLFKDGSRWRFDRSEFESITALVAKPPKAFKRLGEAAAARKRALASRKQHDLELASRKISRALKACGLAKGWKSPAFLPWWVLSRASQNPALSEARGVAKLSWRRGDEDEFQTRVWTLDAGVADLRHLFPPD